MRDAFFPHLHECNRGKLILSQNKAHLHLKECLKQTEWLTTPQTTSVYRKRRGEHGYHVLFLAKVKIYF